MRCDGCNALRFYGLQLQQFSCTGNGHASHVYFLCETCAEERMMAFNALDADEYYLPTMHRPHMRLQ